MATYSTNGVSLDVDEPLSYALVPNTTEYGLKDPHYEEFQFSSTGAQLANRLQHITTLSVSTSAIFKSLLESLYDAYDKHVLFNSYDYENHKIRTTANAQGMFHLISAERTDGTAYTAYQRAPISKYSVDFDVPSDLKYVTTIASTKIIYNEILGGQLEQKYTPSFSASGARASILSSSLIPKPGGFLATIVTDRPSYVYAFVRTNSTKEIVKVVRSKVNEDTHKIYIKIQPGDYTIEYAAFGADDEE